MRPSTKRTLSLAALLAALVAGGTLVPLAWNQRQAPQQKPDAVAVAPAPVAEPEPATPAPPPGTEQVPPEEAEIDRSPNAASPGGPVMSFGRAQGLHQTPDPLRLNSSAAVVVDQASGEVLVQKNAQAVLPIASLTKLMTSVVVLEAKQPMDEVLTITDEDVDRERHSRSRLKVGSTLTREEALHLALMSSENRAAHALGRHYPGGLPKMVEAMNLKAQQLGMLSSSFVDPTGLSNGNRSTARDLALLVKAAAQNPLIAQFSTTRQHVADLGSRSLQYINSNRLVRNGSSGWDIELQKTGYIVEAGRCLTMVTEVAGRELIMVLLDAESNGQRIADAERLRRWAVAQWGGPDAVAALKAETAKPRKVAAAKKREAPTERKSTAVASKKDAPKASASTAKKKDAAKTTAVAKKPSAKSTRTAASAKKDKDGRVRQSFAANKSDSKS
jgi:D-alanyl-D-alanine carboxypeptidase